MTDQTDHMVDDEQEFKQAMTTAPAAPEPGPEEQGFPRDYLVIAHLTPEHDKIAKVLCAKIKALLDQEFKVTAYNVEKKGWLNSKSEEIRMEIGDKIEMKINITEKI